jgi:hypothetical protein
VLAEPEEEAPGRTLPLLEGAAEEGRGVPEAEAEGMASVVAEPETEAEGSTLADGAGVSSVGGAEVRVTPYS